MDADGFQVSNGAVGSLSLLSQTLTTVPGQLYYIDFWIQNDGSGIFNVQFDGVQVYGEAFVGHAYTEHTVLGFASTASTVLQLQSRDDPGFIQFDAISVNAVPEPGSLTLLGLGVVAVSVGGLVRVVRRKAVTT